MVKTAWDICLDFTCNISTSLPTVCSIFPQLMGETGRAFTTSASIRKDSAFKADVELREPFPIFAFP